MPPARLGPKKAINILPSRKIKFVPSTEGKLLPEDSKFSVFGRKKPTLMPSKSGGRAKTGPKAAINKYLERGGRKVISKVYSKNYNVVKSGTKVYAVKIYGERTWLKGGEINPNAIGWLSENGQLTTAKDMRDSLISIDNTTVGREKGVNVLTKKWDSLSMSEKAQVVNDLADFDWDDFWLQMYPNPEEPDVDKQFTLYDNLLMTIENALNRV